MDVFDFSKQLTRYGLWSMDVSIGFQQATRYGLQSMDVLALSKQLPVRVCLGILWDPCRLYMYAQRCLDFRFCLYSRISSRHPPSELGLTACSMFLGQMFSDT